MTNILNVIGVPLDLGANMRGANMGPAAIRIAKLHRKLSVLGYQVSDGGDLPVPIRETLAEHEADENFATRIRDVCLELSKTVYTTLKQNAFPIVLGGDHSIAIGTIAGASRYFRDQGEELGLIWIDAHADMNTPETSPSGNIHGMPLSITLGTGSPELVNLADFTPKVKPENVALIGIRTLDGAEKDLCRKSGVRYFTMREVDERGMHSVMREAIEIAGNATGGIHLSADLDGIDPLYAPGVSTPVTGGLSYRETHLAFEMLADAKKLRSLEIVELNPMTDTAHQTANLAVELIQSALGKSIV